MPNLPWVAAQGYVTEVKDLLEAGEDVNQREAGSTALINAVVADHMDIVLLLLEYNADVDIPTTHGDTALMRAVVEKNMPMVALLLERHADVNKQGKYGDTALMIALKNIRASDRENVYFKIAVLLLQHNADLEITNQKGERALDVVPRSKKEEWEHLIEEHRHSAGFKM